MPNITKCRVCGSINLEEYLNLGDQPWCNDFLTKEQLGTEQNYPLRVALCHDCFTSQLSFTVPKEQMFSNHTYVSGTTKTLKTHFLKLAELVKEKYDIKPNDLVVDIGGNDGTNLLQYKSIGIENLLNVESASNIAEIAINNGIETMVDYFDENVADTIINQKGHAKLVLASGVFFHLEELHSVCKGIQNLLADDGVFVVQFMYFKSIIENLNYDSIYHEHLLYYTISSIMKLLSMYDIFPDDITYSEIHGGSIVLFGKKNIKSKTISESLIHGLEKPMFDIRTYKVFDERVRRHHMSLIGRLVKIGSNNTVHGYGAPAKGNTLINCFQASSFKNHMPLIEEANPLKCGLYTPKSHIPIVHYSEVKERPNYYLVLSWNFLEEFVAKEVEYFRQGGQFIVPFPYDVFLINKNNYEQYLPRL